MTEQEAIERIYSKLMDGTPRDKDACDIAIDAFEKSYHYREMERRLKAVYGDCDNLLKTVVEGFCRHSGVDIGTPVKSRLLTDEDVDKWDAYRAIGTVEECREAVEKQQKHGTEGQVNRMSDLKITKCTGEGQGSCKRCNDYGIWNRHWMSMLYKIEGYEGCYCSECVKEIKAGKQNE